MSLREYVTVIFSKDLAYKTPAEQKQAVIKLHEYVRAHAGIWESDHDFYIEDTFRPFLTGGLELNAIWAEVLGEPFQAEVINGRLTATEKQEVEALGFIALGHTPPQYVQ